MLGMMNSPSDSVEFYAVNKNLYGEMNDEVLKTFTEVKQRQNISYTDDGRRMVDGKITDEESGTVSSLWGNALRRGAVRTHIKVDNKEMEQNESEEHERQETSPKAEVHREQRKVQVVEEPILATVPKHVVIDTVSSDSVSHSINLNYSNCI